MIVYQDCPAVTVRILHRRLVLKVWENVVVSCAICIEQIDVRQELGAVLERLFQNSTVGTPAGAVELHLVLGQQFRERSQISLVAIFALRFAFGCKNRGLLADGGQFGNLRCRIGLDRIVLLRPGIDEQIRSQKHSRFERLEQQIRAAGLAPRCATLATRRTIQTAGSDYGSE